MTSAPAITLFIDADACPVKDETYKVAARYGLKTFVVSNSFIQIPASPLIERVIRATTWNTPAASCAT